MTVKFSEAKDVIFDDCRHNCEFMGAHCNAFVWGPTADRLQVWFKFKDLLDKGKSPTPPKIPFAGSCEIYKKND